MCVNVIYVGRMVVMSYMLRLGKDFFGSPQPARSFRGGRKLRFFERAICDQFWPSSAQRCVFLGFQFFWGVPAHFGNLELTGTRKRLPLQYLVTQTHKTTLTFKFIMSRSIGLAMLLLSERCETTKSYSKIAAKFHLLINHESIIQKNVLHCN